MPRNIRGFNMNNFERLLEEKDDINYWVNKWNATGRIAFIRPRKKRVSLNGGREVSYEEAIKTIKELLVREGHL